MQTALTHATAAVDLGNTQDTPYLHDILPLPITNPFDDTPAAPLVPDPFAALGKLPKSLGDKAWRLFTTSEARQSVNNVYTRLKRRAI